MKTIRVKSTQLPWDDRIIWIRDVEVDAEHWRNGKLKRMSKAMMTEYWTLSWEFDYESKRGDKRRHHVSRMFWRIEKKMYDNIIKKLEKKLEDKDE